MTRASLPSAHDPDHLDAQLLERYWLDEVSPEEREAIEVWFEAHPGRRAQYNQLRKGARADGWTRLSPTQLSARTRAVERAIKTSQEQPRPAAARVPQLVRYALWGIVCVVLALILNTSLHRRFVFPKSVAMTSYVTESGQRSQITLSDGVTITLGVASRLEVPADYLAGDHALRLDGEALFAIPHHTNTPFTVTTTSATARVLGTTFMVRQYTTDSVATVAVREGRVAVASAIVTAGQRADVGLHGKVQLAEADPGQFSFAQGVLVLDSIPMAKAIIELDRWYDADIRLGDGALATRQVTGEFAAGSFADLISILELTFNARVIRDGRVVTIYTR